MLLAATATAASQDVSVKRQRADRARDPDDCAAHRAVVGAFNPGQDDTRIVVVASGMMMLPPVVVSLPFKLIFFVLVDGWSLVAGSLIQSYGA